MKAILAGSLIGLAVALLFALYLFRVGAWDQSLPNVPGYTCQVEVNALGDNETICYPQP